MLSEAGKFFERVLAARFKEHLLGVGSGLDDRQFGFRRGRSTIDAIKRVRSLSEAVVHRDGLMLAVNMDIANAFNALP